MAGRVVPTVGTSSDAGRFMTGPRVLVGHDLGLGAEALALEDRRSVAVVAVQVGPQLQPPCLVDEGGAVVEEHRHRLGELDALRLARGVGGIQPAHGPALVAEERQRQVVRLLDPHAAVAQAALAAAEQPALGGVVQVDGVVVGEQELDPAERILRPGLLHQGLRAPGSLEPRQ